MTREQIMDAQDRLEEAKADLHAATTPEDRADAREEVDHWSGMLFRGGYVEPDQ